MVDPKSRYLRSTSHLYRHKEKLVDPLFHSVFDQGLHLGGFIVPWTFHTLNPSVANVGEIAKLRNKDHVFGKDHRSDNAR